MPRRSYPTYECKICFEIFYKRSSRIIHITQNHGSVRDYAVLTFPKKKTQSIRTDPLCFCGKEKKLISLEQGFRKFCSMKCVSHASHKKIKHRNIRVEDLDGVEILKRYGNSFKDISFKGKTFYKTMGWELLFIRDLENFKITVDQVTTNVPKILWRKREEGKVRHYIPDFFIPFRNLLIEVKSSYTLKASQDEVMVKIKYAQRFGFDVMLIVYEDYSDHDPIIRHYKGFKVKKELKNRLMALDCNAGLNQEISHQVNEC